jgi:hypothetical protein
MLTDQEFRLQPLTQAQIDAATRRAHVLRSQAFVAVMGNLATALLDLFALPVRITRHTPERIDPMRTAHCG